MLLISDQINSFKTSDFCKKDKHKNCKMYSCGTKFCSIDKKTCENFILWTKFMNKYNDEQPKIYSTFIGNIRRCKSNVYIIQK